MAAAATESAAEVMPAAAAPTFAVPTATPAEAITGVGAMVEIVLALAFVLALIVAIAWVSRRMRGTSHAGGLIRILADVSLGQKERAVLLQVGGKRLLVGVTAGGMSLLDSAEMPVDAEATSGGEVARNALAPTFATLLRRSLGRP
jgi:flagellar protein FliO/FliZ